MKKTITFKNLQAILNLKFNDTALLDYDFCKSKYLDFVETCYRTKTQDNEYIKINVWGFDNFWNSTLIHFYTKRDKLSELKTFFWGLHYDFFNENYEIPGDLISK